MRIPLFATQAAGRTKAVWGLLIAALVLVIVGGGWLGSSNGTSPVLGQDDLPAGLPTGEHLIALALPQAQSPQGQSQQGIVIIDPVDRVMSVYHIDLPTGTIKLQSVRRIHWDLKMSDYNGQDPLPGQIQALVNQH
ncbi:MAG: hypothetical protein MPJ50_07975 [Pirellulales bacterium]|nr:hypothetical protein [Pirellulales bacterium]